MKKGFTKKIMDNIEYIHGMAATEFHKQDADIFIFRLQQTDTETIGICFVLGKPTQGNHHVATWNNRRRLPWPQVFFTLELPWRKNKRNISRIPPGTYQAKKFESPRFKREVILLDEVPFRDAIEIHPLNYVHETKGCIGVSLAIGDLNNDGTVDLRYSNYGLDLILDLVPRDLTTTICDYFKKGERK